MNCILLLLSALQWFLARWWSWKGLSEAAMPLAAAMLSNAVCSNSIGQSNAGLPADAMYNAQCGNAHAELQLKLPFRDTKSWRREIQFCHLHVKNAKSRMEVMVLQPIANLVLFHSVLNCTVTTRAFCIAIYRESNRKYDDDERKGCHCNVATTNYPLNCTVPPPIRCRPMLISHDM